MEALIISAVFLGSFAGAFVIQKGTLEGLFRIMDTRRRGLSQDGATNRFAVARVTLRRGESSGAEPHTKGMVAHV